MFENWNRQRKIKAFRGNGVRLKNYDSASRTIDLSAGSWDVHLGFDLVNFDQKLQLAFSGDLITCDGEALSRVMKVMWNEKLPAKFSDNEQLRVQLGKPSPAPIEEAPAEEGEGAEVPPEDGFRPSVQPEPEPLYFRDMASCVAGMPNQVDVTVKASYRIDN